MIKKMILGMMAIGLFATSCSDDDDATVQVPTTAPLTIDLTGLEALGSDFVYEGWVIVNGDPVSTGTFTDVTFPQTFQVGIADLAAATTFVLSVEPLVDPDPAPAATKVLAGDFSGSQASVSTGLIGDFSNAAGSFFFRTPTDETAGNNMNDEFGVWYGLPGTPPAAALTLPTLPDGWAYEGWVIGESGPLTTGTFTEFNTADDNAGAATSFSGTENTGPPIPGEDFFNNAPTGETFPLDVSGRMIVISVEPVPDDSPAPFALKPLLSMPQARTVAPDSHMFDQNLGSLPTGIVTR